MLSCVVVTVCSTLPDDLATPRTYDHCGSDRFKSGQAKSKKYALFEQEAVRDVIESGPDSQTASSDVLDGTDLHQDRGFLIRKDS